jgi:hypothetical protein
MTDNSTITAIITVPQINAFGITRAPSFVSAARNVAVSQPKKVSAMKKIVMKTMEGGFTKKGIKFPMLISKKLGMMRPNTAMRVMNENDTNIIALVFIPLYAM